MGDDGLKKPMIMERPQRGREMMSKKVPGALVPGDGKHAELMHEGFVGETKYMVPDHHLDVMKQLVDLQFGPRPNKSLKGKYSEAPRPKPENRGDDWDDGDKWGYRFTEAFDPRKNRFGNRKFSSDSSDSSDFSEIAYADTTSGSTGTGTSSKGSGSSKPSHGTAKTHTSSNVSALSKESVIRPSIATGLSEEINVHSYDEMSLKELSVDGSTASSKGTVKSLEEKALFEGLSTIPLSTTGPSPDGLYGADYVPFTRSSIRTEKIRFLVSGHIKEHPSAKPIFIIHQYDGKSPFQNEKPDFSQDRSEGNIKIALDGKFYKDSVLKEENNFPKFLDLKPDKINIDSRSQIWETDFSEVFQVGDHSIRFYGQFIKSIKSGKYTPFLGFQVKSLV